MSVENLSLVDLERYPLHDLAGIAGQTLVRTTRAEFDQNGLVALPGFLRPETVDAIVDQALKDAESGSYRFAGTSDIFFNTEPGKERSTELKYTKTDIPYDRISPESPVRVLYGLDDLLAFISAVVGRPVYRSADPLGAAVIQIQNDGDEQDWHFDISEFTILLHAQAPREGGVLQYALRTRDNMLREPDMLSRITAGDPSIPVRELPVNPGMLVLHAGSVSLHRVTPTRGDIPRVSGTLTFNSAPGRTLNEYTRRLHFGRDR
jgi:hypothetical protein